MWHKIMDGVSRTLLDDHRHDYMRLPCVQLKPNRDLRRGLSAPSRGTAYVMIKPDSGTLALHVLSEKSYRSVLEKMGDVVESEFNFASVTDKNLFVAVHRHGHFYQKIDTRTVMKEISDYALQHDCAFLLQIDAVNRDLAPLHENVSRRLEEIQKPIRVKDGEGYRTRDHPEKRGDLAKYGKEILASLLKFGQCSSLVIWCFSEDPPGVGFAGSEVFGTWLRVDSAVISRTVTVKNKIVRWLLRRPKNRKVGDIFNSGGGTHHMIRFPVNWILTKETERYLGKRKNSPVFFFDGNLQLDLENVQSSGSVDSPSQTRPESLEGVGY